MFFIVQKHRSFVLNVRIRAKNWGRITLSDTPPWFIFRKNILLDCYLGASYDVETRGGNGEGVVALSHIE